MGYKNPHWSVRGFGESSAKLSTMDSFGARDVRKCFTVVFLNLWFRDPHRSMRGVPGVLSYK